MQSTGIPLLRQHLGLKQDVLEHILKLVLKTLWCDVEELIPGSLGSRDTCLLASVPLGLLCRLVSAKNALTVTSTQVWGSALPHPKEVSRSAAHLKNA